jgi:peptide/nickel transport system substrate-binding protein
VLVTSGQSPLHIPLNNKHPFLSDKRVRQALLSAIDREALIEDIFQGAAKPATSNMSPAFPQWYNPDVVKYPYDAAKAASLLDEAGWALNGDTREKDGERATFTCFNVAGNTTRRSILETVQQYLADVGVALEIEEAPVATILEQLPKGEMDAAIFEWTYGTVEPDATQTLKTGEVNNWSSFSNARVDELLAQGLLEVDPEKRAPIYKEIQAIVAEEVPFLFLLHRDWYQIFTKRIQGLPEAPLDFFYVYAGAYKYWIEE